MDLADKQRHLGWLGLAGVACAVVSAPLLSIWTFPGTGESGAAVLAFFAHHRSGITAGLILDIVGCSLWGAVGVAAWVRMQAAGEAYRAEAGVFAVGYAAFTALLLAGFLCGSVLAGQPVTPDGARLLYDLTFGLIAVSGLPFAAAMLAFAAFARRTGAYPAVTVWVAGLAAVTHIALVFSVFVRGGFFSLEGQVIGTVPGLQFLWFAVTGVAVVRARDRAATGPGTPVPAVAGG